MKVSKVRNYKPGYPRKEDALSNPNLLKNIPNRWKNLLLTGSVLSFLLLASCDMNDPQKLLSKLIPKSTLQGHTSGMIVLKEFDYTDEEAISVILDEFAKHGITFEVDNTCNVHAELPVDVRMDAGNQTFDYYTLLSGLDVDGHNEEYNISFEYVSQDDFSKWTSNELLLSGFLRKEFLDYFFEDGLFKTENDEFVMAFYNHPHYDPAGLEEDLRNQVREFIHMLESQGII